ncbi:MAG: M20/M25/M40 family metallo-hydrolase [Oscillospiraceae bacterium]|nr:M20/M25/M40 family metallo-hydrolase [Oscillospiraceae bacterium]
MEEKMIKYIDDHEAEMIELWKDIVRIESPSYHKEGVDKVAAVLEKFCTEKLGYHIRYLQDDVYGNCLAACSCPFEEYKNGIVISAHMDTVHKIGSFMPLIAEDDTFLYGPGAGDCKAGVIMALLTAAALKEIGYNKRPIKLVFAADEESGGPTGKVFYPRELEGSDYMFNAESGIREKLVTGRKSSIIAVYNIKGEAAHIGYIKGRPKSAISEAAQKLIALESSSDYDMLTFCCGIINGGTGPTSSPASCQMQVNVRIKDDSVIDKAINILTTVAETTYVEGTSCELEIRGNRVPMSERPANRWLCEQFSKASQSLGFCAYDCAFTGGASDASYASAMHIPVVCSSGPIVDYQHTKNERADIKSMAERAKVHVKTILDLPDGPCPI